jgi:hypothetical protein
MSCPIQCSRAWFWHWGTSTCTWSPHNDSAGAPNRRVQQARARDWSRAAWFRSRASTHADQAPARRSGLRDTSGPGDAACSLQPVRRGIAHPAPPARCAPRSHALPAWPPHQPGDPGRNPILGAVVPRSGQFHARGPPPVVVVVVGHALAPRARAAGVHAQLRVEGRARGPAQSPRSGSDSASKADAGQRRLHAHAEPRREPTAGGRRAVRETGVPLGQGAGQPHPHLVGRAGRPRAGRPRAQPSGRASTQAAALLQVTVRGKLPVAFP